MEDLTGPGPGREHRVVAQHPRVAEGGALLRVAVDLTDRGVHVDRHRPALRPGARRPGPPDRLGDHRVELADMPERERSQERPQRRGGHHPERQHRLGSAGAETVRVIDVGSSGQDRGHQRQHLATRTGPADPVDESNPLVHEGLETEPDHQRGRHDQPGVGHQRRVIEGHRHAVDRARYSTSPKVPPRAADPDDFDIAIVPAQEALFADTRPSTAHLLGGSRLRGCADRFAGVPLRGKRRRFSVWSPRLSARLQVGRTRIARSRRRG